MDLTLNNKQIHSIIQRFNSKFKLRIKKDNPNPKHELFSLNDIYIIKTYKFPCTYSNVKSNEKRENLVIKYFYKNKKEIISLNLLLEEYKDLVHI